MAVSFNRQGGRTVAQVDGAYQRVALLASMTRNSLVPRQIVSDVHHDVSAHHAQSDRSPRGHPYCVRRAMTAFAVLAFGLPLAIDRSFDSWLHIAMKSVKIATLKDELSMHIRAVERGASYVVTDRDRPVAQLVPVIAEDGFDLTPASKPFSAVSRRRFRRTRSPIDSLALLQKERGSR